MTDLVEYRTPIFDNSRWLRFEHRPGDIVISTPPKSGTTWTQMLCALMIFDGPDFPANLDGLAPWFDMLIRTDDQVFEIYDNQTHRRFMKTHTPLDGIPMRDDVTYLVVGRDPRDVMISMEHHSENMNTENVAAVLAESGSQLPDAPDRTPEESDPAARFRSYVESEDGWFHLARVVHHLRTGWDRRGQPNVGVFHYADYQRDLVAEMIRIADIAGIDISAERIAELAPEAGLARMRSRAAELAPDVTRVEIWKDPARFFRSGGSGEWMDRTTEADRELYENRITQIAPDPEFAAWVHGGWAALHDGV